MFKLVYVIILALTTSVGFGAVEQATDISVRRTEPYEVCYRSDRTVYVESLKAGRWLGRCWNSNGHKHGRWETDAFQIEINGEKISTGWNWLSAKELTQTNRGARHFVVALSNSSRPLIVKVHTLLDGTAIITRRLEITNTSDQSVALTAISPWSTQFWADSGFKNTSANLGQPFKVGYFTKDDWANEGWFEWKPLSVDEHAVVECDKGNGYNDPFFMVQNTYTGQYMIGHLAWTANWKMKFTCRKGPNERHPWGDELSAPCFMRIAVGPSAKDALCVIAPGETVQSPAVHLGLITGDLDTAVQSMHRHIRSFVLPEINPNRRYLLQYLAPGGSSYVKKPDGRYEGKILEHVDRAASVGAELFILDCGWSKTRGAPWLPDAKRYSDGLAPISNYCHQKGLLFGLWIEPERSNPVSELTKEHPDWIIPQGTLNLAEPVIAQYVEKELERQIEDYNLDLIRTAFDTPFVYEGFSTSKDGYIENNYWRYYDVCYRMYEQIHERYPDLIMQNCSQGIGRGDLGLAQWFHEGYLTDGLWLPQVLLVYAGQSMALPPEVFALSIETVFEKFRGRPENIDTFLRCQYALAIPQICSGAVPDMNDKKGKSLRQRFLRYGNLYKTFFRPVWPTAKVYHHDPINSRGGVSSSGWFCMEFGSPDRKKAWTVIVRIGQSSSDIYTFRPRSIDPGKTYQVTLDSSGSSVAIEGWQLINDGLTLRLENRTSSELLLFETQ